MPIPDSESTINTGGPAATLSLSVAALGVVFGDIGTSPLYALRECFNGPHGFSPSPDNVIGIVSLMLWTLILVVSVKYVLVVMRADNRSEGGILALMTLVANCKTPWLKKHHSFILSLGLLGAALLYGDGVITPAISVLSAVEGLNVATPLFKPVVLPISIVILLALFFIQSRGTTKIGALFGPVMILWFAAIAALGLMAIAGNPAIAAAINPVHAARFFAANGWRSFTVLGSVFLCVTGAEVLYADLGHFGRRPIRRAWFVLAFPALLLNYAGQGAYLLRPAPTIENLFYQIVPPGFLYPMVILSALATIIASQAVISGAFSVARQSVQLGFWPRLEVRHTSSSTIGQVYVPFVNWGLMVGVLLLMLGFRESGNLGAAYGIAVSGTMLITSVLILFVARLLWRVPLATLVPAALLLLTMDLSFFGSNIIKVASGGWIIMVIAIGIYLLMKTWIDGREVLRKNVESGTLDLEVLLNEVRQLPPLRVPGAAVFLTGNPRGVPRALLHNLKHNKVLHEQTIIVSVLTEEIPTVAAVNRIRVETLGEGLFHVTLSFGFSETPNIPLTLKNLSNPQLHFNPDITTYFLGHEALVITHRRSIALWRKGLYSFMSQNSQNARSFFKLPANRVVELGSLVEL